MDVAVALHSDAGKRADDSLWGHWVYFILTEETVMSTALPVQIHARSQICS